MFDPHVDCNLCSTNPNQEGSTMSEFITADAAVAADLREKVAELQLERNQAKAERDTAIIERDEARALIAGFDALQIARNKAVAEVEVLSTSLRGLKASLQYDLKEWAEQNLTPGDTDYQELHDLMVSNDLEGLKRTFTVNVSVTYTFEVEVEATDEDEARDVVDNDLDTYVGDNVNLWDTPDDYDIEATEA